MQDAENDNADKEIITIYAPIFREKLTRLETRGQENTVEANELRTALARIDRAKACSERELPTIYAETILSQKHQSA